MKRTKTMFDQSVRSKYAEYIAAGVRFALKETGERQFPDSTRIVVLRPTSPLADYNQLIGFNILITDMPSSYEFCLAIGNEEEHNLLKAFYEYMELYPMEVDN